MASRTISPQEAALERIRRELARRELTHFGEYVLPWWQAAAVHQLMCEALEQVLEFIISGGERGTGALIVEIPPQHGKSTVVSQIFPAWLLGKRPDSRIMLTSYGADLAQDHSRAVRNIVTGEKFAAVFGGKSALDDPVEISEDATSRSSWSLAEPHRGGVLAAGVGGPVTGKPAELIVVDDPFKNREEAESPNERKKKLKWLTSSVLPRMRKGSAIIMIHTRWHREDLIGEMLKAQVQDAKARQWKVLSLPALPLEAEEYAVTVEDQRTAMLAGLFRPFEDPLGRQPGSLTPLWPEEFPLGVLEQTKATLEASGQVGDWYALYQQKPRPEEGVIFSEADFQVIERAPERLQWYRYVDPALGKKKTSDWNSTLAAAMDEQGNVYYRDMIRVRQFDEFMARMVAAMKDELEKGTIWGIESVSFSALVFRELMQKRELANVAIKEVKPEADKVTRARPLQTRAKAGKVFLVRGAWVQSFLMELLDFPTGAHDDQVDTASGGLEMIATGKVAKLPEAQPQQQSKWRESAEDANAWWKVAVNG